MFVTIYKAAMFKIITILFNSVLKSRIFCYVYVTVFILVTKWQLKEFSKISSHSYSRNVTDVDWRLVVKLALPGKVTRRAYKVFEIYD
jgi:hypothetical protein